VVTPPVIPRPHGDYIWGGLPQWRPHPGARRPHRPLFPGILGPPTPIAQAFGAPAPG